MRWQFIPVVHEADCIADPRDRARALESLGDEILKRNDMVLFGGVMNQAFPLNRGIGGRWFDEMGWAPDILKAAEMADEPATAGRSPERGGPRRPGSRGRESMPRSSLPTHDGFPDGRCTTDETNPRNP